jgi:hypothetical protein
MQQIPTKIGLEHTLAVLKHDKFSKNFVSDSKRCAWVVASAQRSRHRDPDPQNFSPNHRLVTVNNGAGFDVILTRNMHKMNVDRGTCGV